MATKLQVWLVTSHRGSATVEYLSHQLEPFFHRHADIEIEWRLLAWETACAELIRAFKQGSPPDVFEFGTTWLGMFAHLGTLTPVPNGFLDTRPIAGYFDEVTTYRGTSYGVGWTIDLTCFMARQDVLQQIDVNPGGQLSWDEFMEICQIIMRRRQATMSPTGTHPKPLAFSWRPERVTLHRSFPWLWAGGFQLPELMHGDIEVLTSPTIRPSLDYIQSLMRVSHITLDEARSSTHNLHVSFFNEGAQAFHVTGWHSVLLGIQEDGGIFESDWPVCAIPLPRGPNGSVPYGGGSVLGVSRTCEHQAAAWELVRTLIQPDNLAEWALWTGVPPAYPCPFWDKHEHNTNIQVLRQSLDDARTYPTHPVWSSFERTLAVGLSDLLWHLVDHDYDAELAERTTAVDAELNQWLRFAWEVT